MNFEQPSGGGNDLFYPVNHSCDPNVAFDLSSEDTSQWHVRALTSIKVGDPCESRDTPTLSVLTSAETVTVTFFYPSTQWTMAQPFDCLCGSMVRLVSPLAHLDSQKQSIRQECLGRIEGAISLTARELSSHGFINPWIWAQFEAKWSGRRQTLKNAGKR